MNSNYFRQKFDEMKTHNTLWWTDRYIDSKQAKCQVVIELTFDCKDNSVLVRTMMYGIEETSRIQIQQKKWPPASDSFSPFGKSKIGQKSDVKSRMKLDVEVRYCMEIKKKITTRNTSSFVFVLEDITRLGEIMLDRYNVVQIG